LGCPGRLGDGALALEEDLLAVDLDRTRRPDAQPYLVTPDFQDGDDDVAPDHDALVGAARENEHERSFVSVGRCAGPAQVRGVSAIVPFDRIELPGRSAGSMVAAADSRIWPPTCGFA
jgi:hypothetical protein